MANKRKSDAVSGQTTNASEGPSANDSAISTRNPNKRHKPTIVDEANDLDADEFMKRYLNDELIIFGESGESSSNIWLQYANRLKVKEFDECFDLIETTSRDDYEASTWGWHPRRKKREMKEREMRYLIATEDASTERKFQGFLSFMLTHDSTPSVPVLYVYEIHLTREARGKGLGHHLMNMAEDIARRAGMDKVMLTCFLSNTKAHDFYERLGYTSDECSPEDRKTRNKIVKTDYVIMSKDLRTPPTTVVNGTGQTGALHQVIEHEPTETLDDFEANDNGISSLDECETALRAWAQEHLAKEVLNEGLVVADSARRALCANDMEAANVHRDVLAQHHQFLQTRYEAARDLTEVLREQMYHLKCQISDVNRLAEMMANVGQHKAIAAQIEISNDEDFDMEKATEQVYAAFYTLMRKAEEVDNRLDNVADREEEASVLEYDLNQREEELDTWEYDLHEREKALAAREERLMRSKLRVTGRGQRNEITIAGEEESPEGEAVRALPWRQESPPRNKVSTWLYQSETPVEQLEACPAMTIDDDPPTHDSRAT